MKTDSITSSCFDFRQFRLKSPEVFPQSRIIQVVFFSKSEKKFHTRVTG
jgi:hypothetical protein